MKSPVLYGSCRFAILQLPLRRFLSFSTDSVAGETWTKAPIAKYVLNNKQDALAFGDGRNGWYGNGTGTVYGRTDGGETWKSVCTRRGTYVRALKLADDRVGFLGNVGPGYFSNVTDRQPLYVTAGNNGIRSRPFSGRHCLARWSSASGMAG